MWRNPLRILLVRVSLLSMFLVIALWPCAHALVFVKFKDIYLYYPSQDKAVAERLYNDIPGMVTFLATKGLCVKTPLHVVLDKDRDTPDVSVVLKPHREIRIPLRAPGVLEDGYLERDPWSYFLFKGLCIEAIYSMRFRVPALLSRIFGEIRPPNLVLPPWIKDGTCHLLYQEYMHESPRDPYAKAIFMSSIPPDISMASNHPGAWPGYFGYRIYGRPFIAWIDNVYGWNRILKFLKIHGGGIIPFEINLKAKKAFGRSWVSLWREFRSRFTPRPAVQCGLLVTGYEPGPLVYWNMSGVYPGLQVQRLRSRYGYRAKDGSLYISEYGDDGISRIVTYTRGRRISINLDHVWDPGRRGVAVTRKGRRPFLVLLSYVSPKARHLTCKKLVPGPPGAIQMSGPQMNQRGTIAVAVNIGGNWDIWTYDKSWHRLTSWPSIEMDPYWFNGKLYFSSNKSGRFQIYTDSFQVITRARHAAIMPKQGYYLDLGSHGWKITRFNAKSATKAFKTFPRQGNNRSISPPTTPPPLAPMPKPRPYTPRYSILPDYVEPDIFLSSSEKQIGLTTHSSDITGKFTTDLGLRYSSDMHDVSWILGAMARDTGFQISRYPLSYDTYTGGHVDETIYNLKLYWKPLGHDWLDLSLNRIWGESSYGAEKTDLKWVGLQVHPKYGSLSLWGTLEIYTNASQSLYGGAAFVFGERLITSIMLEAGKTRGRYVEGYSSFRIGGNTGEGYFTKRPTRLFPLRGFDDNILEANKAITANIEVYWPILNLQRGYYTIPIFLHRIYLGTFIDTGACRDSISTSDFLVGTGLELVSTTEIEWTTLSFVKIGLGWPIHQPGYLNQKGPVFLFQIGQPL